MKLTGAFVRRRKFLKLPNLLTAHHARFLAASVSVWQLARAIVREPDLFLFDEPLSNLDAALRVQTRVEIARLHKRLGTTMIYATHDQVEAMTLADKIVVLRVGVIEQIGSPIKLYEEPANMFVAQFIGSPKMNFFNKDDLTAAGGKLLDNSADCLGLRSDRKSWRKCTCSLCHRNGM
jgi:ABC-type sugar transport system ATPase subunit